MQVLAEMDGDVDAAIEYMIAERLTVYTDDTEENTFVDNAYNGKSSECSYSWETRNLFQRLILFQLCSYQNVKLRCFPFECVLHFVIHPWIWDFNTMDSW